MKIHIYLDESGSIHKNSVCNYFAIGGFMVLDADREKVIAKYKRKNKKQKLHRGMPLNEELKTRNMTVAEKIELINAIQNIDSFFGCAIVFDKTSMIKAIDKSNIFFNYGIKILFKDTIIPLLNQNISYEFILSIDNRNISVGEIKHLEAFLNTEFCCYDYSFSVTYYDSASHYGIQLADLIVNTFYMRVKNKEIVKDVLETMNLRNFRVNQFPGKTYIGRKGILNFDSSNELTKTR